MRNCIRLSLRCINKFFPNIITSHHYKAQILKNKIQIMNIQAQVQVEKLQNQIKNHKNHIIYKVGMLQM